MGRRWHDGQKRNADNGEQRPQTQARHNRQHDGVKLAWLATTADEVQALTKDVASSKERGQVSYRFRRQLERHVHLGYSLSELPGAGFSGGGGGKSLLIVFRPTSELFSPRSWSRTLCWGFSLSSDIGDSTSRANLTRRRANCSPISMIGRQRRPGFSGLTAAVQPGPPSAAHDTTRH